MTRYPKRLIEVDLPIKRISAHARREKSIRHGHISTLHIWWARKPLATCRAVICAALWLDPCDELCPNSFRLTARQLMQYWAKNHLNLISSSCFERFLSYQKDPELLDKNLELRKALLDFIADFSDWNNTTNKEYIKIANQLTQASHVALGGLQDTRPLLIDPFAGGGAIPLEAIRSGAEAFASDLNPVAVLLNKVVIEYIQLYGHRLADEVRKMGVLVKKLAKKELVAFYPMDDGGSVPIAYLWARTIQCEGPGCGATIPLLSTLWLSEGKNNRIALEPIINQQSKKIDFIIEEDVSPTNKKEGFLRRSSVTCPVCGFTTPANQVRAQFKGRFGGANDAKLITVITGNPHRPGKNYRLPKSSDFSAFEAACSYIQEIKTNPYYQNLYSIPTEELPYLRSIFNINLLDVKRWCDLFSSRQLAALLVFSKIIRTEIPHYKDEHFTKAVKSCLALALDRLADYNSSLCRWVPKGQFLGNTFGRQALGIIWTFAECNPFSHATGNWLGGVEWVAKVCEKQGAISLSNGSVSCASATNHPLPDDSAQLFCTDPPYYDLVPYADLSDFFYVWLKRTLVNEEPELFSDEEAPKKEEIVQLAERNKKYSYKTRENYENLMWKAMSEARRVISPSGIGVLFFAHKGTAAWESQLDAMIKAGWIICGSWPIDTEMAERLRAKNSAVLASSIQLVCRPREKKDGTLIIDSIGDWRDVLSELPKRIHEWMPRLAEEGVVGADAIFACLGPALEIYSRYSSVEKASGEKVELKEYLEEVWAAVSREALAMIFEGADASGFEEDARLTAMWLWTLQTALNGNNGKDDAIDSTKSLPGYSLEYDAARKIAQGLGAHLEALSHLVEIKGSTAVLLSAAARTHYLFGKDASETSKRKQKKKSRQLTLFDVEKDIEQIEEEAGGWVGEIKGKPGSTVLDQLHQCMILFGAGRGEAMKRFLVEEGVGRNPLFWRLAQALSALYPAGTDEKRWVDGVLARKKGLGL